MSEEPTVSIVGEYGQLVSYSRDEFLELSQTEQIEIMVEWFHSIYEDPAIRTPYESREGGYQWIWGGPYEANEEVSGHFYEVADEETIELAVQEIESDGLFDWTLKERPGDYEDDFDDEPSLSDDDAKAVIKEQLQSLKAALEPLNPTLNGGIGHNQPPADERLDLPLSRSDWDQLTSEIDQVETQSNANAKPDTAALQASQSTLQFYSAKLVNWLKDRLQKGINKGVETIISTSVIGGTAFGALTLSSGVEKAIAALNSTYQAISHWLQALANSL